MGPEGDISTILDAWPVDAKAVRVINGPDGRAKIQRRLPLGLLQFEMDGRPDGQRPEGHESVFDHLKARVADAPDSTTLSSQDCRRLAAEALLYYQRRLCFFELEEYAKAAADARRNLDVFAFAREHAADEDDARLLDQYRGFVIYHRARAESLAHLKQRDFASALEAIAVGKSEIASFYEEYDLAEELVESEELEQLEALRQRIEVIRPRDRRRRLEDKLADAVKREKYELAAELRDQLRNLET